MLNSSNHIGEEIDRFTVPADEQRGPQRIEGVQGQRLPVADILFLNHACSLLRQSSNPVCGSWKRQASSPWA